MSSQLSFYSEHLEKEKLNPFICLYSVLSHPDVLYARYFKNFPIMSGENIPPLISTSSRALNAHSTTIPPLASIPLLAGEKWRLSAKILQMRMPHS